MKRRTTNLVLGDDLPQALFDQRTHGRLLARRELFCLRQQRIGYLDGGLHMATHIS